jgi:hypothetical protein
VAECQPRLERAGAGAPTPARGGESAVAAGAPRRASRPRRPAPCGPLLAPLPACLGRLFPASAGTARAPQGHPGHRPYAGALGLEPVPTRQCLCPTGHGRRRSAVPRAEEPHHGPTSPGLRLSPGARRLSGSIRSATVVRDATAARTSAQALGHHGWRGPGQRGVRTAWPQRVDPAKRGFTGCSHLSNHLSLSARTIQPHREVPWEAKSVIHDSRADPFSFSFLMQKIED